jgi:hypothetical protein
VADTRHQIVVSLDPDDRLVAAVGGAARYLADAAKLENEAILQFQASVVAACQHCFHCHSQNEPCGITLRREPDRIEVEVALPGPEPPPEDKPSWDGIDEVHCETREHAVVLRLTKHIPPAPPTEEQASAD